MHKKVLLAVAEISSLRLYCILMLRVLCSSVIDNSSESSFMGSLLRVRFRVCQPSLFFQSMLCVCLFLPRLRWEVCRTQFPSRQLKHLPIDMNLHRSHYIARWSLLLRMTQTRTQTQTPNAAPRLWHAIPPASTPSWQSVYSGLTIHSDYVIIQAVFIKHVNVMQFWGERVLLTVLEHLLPLITVTVVSIVTVQVCSQNCF